MIAVCAGCALTPLRTIRPAHILIDRGQIAAIGLPSQVPIPAHAEVVTVENLTVVPGFVDTHTHGRDGVYFGEDVASTLGVCRSVVATGVTALLPTLAALRPVRDSLAEILAQIDKVRHAMLMDNDGAEIVGIHLEGPYLSGMDSVKGSQRVENLRRPSPDELLRMVDVAEGHIRKMSIAPELDGALALIGAMSRLGIVACAAHSAASYEQTMAAVDVGLRCATHVFNGMPPLHHRQPGLLGAILTDDRLQAELIADGQHVSAPAIQVLLRCKGVEGVHLVTDNTLWAGMPDGHYADDGRTVIKEGNRVYVAGGTLIGSVAPMNLCVRTMARLPGCSLAEAVQMASLNPARLIGLSDRKGSLEPGHDADLVVIDEEVTVHRVMVRGSWAYRRATQAGRMPM
jgi:N-acetylglucosamine-6-phosphate deacetylase